MVSDGELTWRLLADTFGAVLLRLQEALPPDTGRQAASVDARGTVHWDHDVASFLELDGATSQACDGQTLAVTLSTSHHVFVLARVRAHIAPGARS